MAPAFDGGLDQGAGLVGVDILDRRQVDIGFPFALHVHHLAADHSVRAGTVADFVDNGEEGGRRHFCGSTQGCSGQ